MLTVITQQRCDDDTLYNRLHGAGLAVRMGEHILPRCELYAQYFRGATQPCLTPTSLR